MLKMANAAKTVDKTSSSYRTKKTEEATKSFLFLLDQRCFDALQNHKVPVLPYSHDKNLLLFAHEALRKGHSVYFARTIPDAVAGNVLSVSSVYPTFEGEKKDRDVSQVDIVSCSGIEHLNVRDHFSHAKIVGVLPALHMIESPLAFSAQQPIAWINALRYHLDFVITQNERMRDILAMLCQWLARWNPRDRVIVAPLGYAPEALVNRDDRLRCREALGIGEAEIVIVNAGGAWGWTDCDTCVKALIQYSQEKKSNIRLYLPGLRQSDNEDVNNVANAIENLKVSHPRMFGTKLSSGRPICIETSWARGGQKLPSVISAADVGLNVSKMSFESWQSHRVRFVDYLSNDLPVLSTAENIMAEKAKDSCLTVEAGNINSYMEAFSMMEEGGVLKSLRDNVKTGKSFLDSRNTYGRAIETILSVPRREVGKLEESVLDLEHREILYSIKHNVGKKIDEYLVG